MLSVKLSTIHLLVLVSRNLLAPHQTVALNVLAIVNALVTWLVSIKNVGTLVPALAEIMQNAELLVIHQIAFAKLDLLGIHLAIAIHKYVRLIIIMNALPTINNTNI